MGIVDYLSRDPKGEPWPESVLVEKFVVTLIESFHKALDCLHSRLSDHDRLERNENVLEYSRINQIVTNQSMSSNSCYGNQNGLKWTRHDRTKEKRFRVRCNEKCAKNQNSTQKLVYLKIVSNYSRLNHLNWIKI